MATVTQNEPCDLAGLQRQAVEDYRELVGNLAAGGNIDPPKVREILRDADVDFATLEADLVKMKTRRQAAADLRKADDLAQRVTEADAAERSSREKYETTRQDLQQRIDAAYQEHRAVVDKAEELRKEKTQLESDARRYLNQTADPGIRAAADALRRRIGALRDWLNQDTVRSVRALPAKRDALQQKGTPQDVADLDERIDAEQTTLSRVAEVESEIADLQQQILEIEGRVYDPEEMAWK